MNEIAITYDVCSHVIYLARCQSVPAEFVWLQARDILDVFLSFSTGCEFRSWLAYTAGSNSEKAFMTYKCLKEWCKNFLPRARC